MRKLLRNLYLNFAGVLRKHKPGIHIINAHYVIPGFPKKEDWIIFESFLKYLNKKCKLISVQEATQLILSHQFPTKECLVAFTFDDGFEECFTIIAPLLEKYNCRGAFFINANYIGSDIAYQNQFNERTKIYTKKPMSWKQVIDLHKRGHVIGSHTLDHVNLAGLTKEEMDYQIRVNKQILEDKLDYNCEYFAWTFGQTKHFSEELLRQTLKYHKYIFSATNYKEYFSYNGKVINRRHIEPFWHKNHINYFLSVKKEV